MNRLPPDASIADVVAAVALRSERTGSVRILEPRGGSLQHAEKVARIVGIGKHVELFI